MANQNGSGLPFSYKNTGNNQETHSTDCIEQLPSCRYTKRGRDGNTSSTNPRSFDSWVYEEYSPSELRSIVEEINGATNFSNYNSYSSSSSHYYINHPSGSWSSNVDPGTKHCSALGPSITPDRLTGPPTDSSSSRLTIPYSSIFTEAFSPKKNFSNKNGSEQKASTKYARQLLKSDEEEMESGDNSILDEGIPVGMPIKYTDRLDPTPDEFLPVGRNDTRYAGHSSDNCVPKCVAIERVGDQEGGSHTCFGCQKPVHDSDILYLKDHGYWHADCLNCSNCQENLSSQKTCFLKNDQIYCRDDYQILFGWSCVKCSLQFKKEQDWMRVAGQHRYHIACFLCKICKRQLGNNEKYHLVNGTDIYCTNHYRDMVTGENSDGQQPPKKAKRNRTSYTEAQIKFLQESFLRDSNPDGNELERIAAHINLKKRVVQVWFQNSRAKLKKSANNNTCDVYGQGQQYGAVYPS